MIFDTVEEIESVCWQMRQADFPRGRNRALINNLFNGFPPYTQQEEDENEIAVNVNFLEGTRLGHDARMQFYQSILKPGTFFTCTTDTGPPHKREHLQHGVHEIHQPADEAFLELRRDVALQVRAAGTAWHCARWLGQPADVVSRGIRRRGCLHPGQHIALDGEPAVLRHLSQLHRAGADQAHPWPGD